MRCSSIPPAVVFLAGFALIYRTIHSPFGQVLKAIRENELRAVSLGYDTDRHKHLAFVLSATLAGLAGATKALMFQLASLTDVHWSMSGEVVLMTLLGGLPHHRGLGARPVLLPAVSCPLAGGRERPEAAVAAVPDARR
jgi:ABC-type branched-subunit amino acid transport system permease subunit